MTTVLVTRPAGAGDPLVAELESVGFRVRAVPTVATRRLPVEWPDLARFDWIVVTSAAGVDTLPRVAAGPPRGARRGGAAPGARAEGGRGRGVAAEGDGGPPARSHPAGAGGRDPTLRGPPA